MKSAIVTIDLNGQKYDFVISEKKFSTGSIGFHGNGKILISENERYTVNIILVKIGSKPKA